MIAMDRRQFVRAISTAPIAGAAAVRAYAQAPKLRFALIGCGWYGMVDTKAALRSGGVECVAICDVDSAHLDQSAADIGKSQGSPPRKFKDYRECLAMPGLGAVIIATPPHWHALPFIEACRRGLAVYLEKPVSYDIREAQAMIRESRKAGNIVQVGFQRRQSDAFRSAAEHIRSGKPGRLVQVDAQIHYQAQPLDNTPQDPPASLDWDFWCGPAPKLPYSPNVAHRAWRLEKHYGNGHLVDWGIHLVDAVRTILGEGAPRSVQAAGGIYQMKGRITTPDTLTAVFEFERCPVVWRHRLWGAAEWSPETNNGILFYCEKETIFVSDSRMVVIPVAKGASRTDTPAAVNGDEQQNRQVGEFLEAVRQKRQPGCTLEDAAASTAAVQLAMISYETGVRVEWDAARGEIRGNPSAAALLKREYRTPWVHP